MPFWIGCDLRPRRYSFAAVDERSLEGTPSSAASFARDTTHLRVRRHRSSKLRSRISAPCRRKPQESLQAEPPRPSSRAVGRERYRDFVSLLEYSSWTNRR